jgi:hypothetical protein
VRKQAASLMRLPTRFLPAISCAALVRGALKRRCRQTDLASVDYDVGSKVVRRALNSHAFLRRGGSYTPGGQSVMKTPCSKRERVNVLLVVSTVFVVGLPFTRQHSHLDPPVDRSGDQ